MHQRVYLPVGGLDLPLVELLVGGNGGGGQSAVQRQHTLSTSVTILSWRARVRRVIEVDGADGELFMKSCPAVVSSRAVELYASNGLVNVAVLVKMCYVNRSSRSLIRLNNQESDHEQ